MASKSIEDVHVIQLNKLIAESDLECLQSLQESIEPEEIEGVFEEQSSIEEKEEAALEEVEKEEVSFNGEEEIHEELPEIFPSPSLRYLLPENVRQIEKENRIHVIPEVFRTDIDPAAIPKIAQMAPQKYIDILAEMLGCKDYKRSLAEFWFLDTLANLLRRAQEDKMNRPTQAVLMLWFCEWIKEMQHFDAADRQRMLRRFKENMLAAAKFVAEEDHLPTPTQAGVYYKVSDEMKDDRSHTTESTIVVDKHAVTFEGAAFECSLRDLTKIIHYIFDLFSTDYQYNLVRSVFTHTPDYAHIDAPYQLNTPKRMYAVLKPLKKDKLKSPKTKDEKPQKGKKKEPDTAEYIALMETKAKDQLEFEEQQERDREDYNRRSHVLPLMFAVNDELFEKYWPTPVVEPEPVPEPEVKEKGKGKK